MRLRPVCDSPEYCMRKKLLRHTNGQAGCGETLALNSRIRCLSCAALFLPVRAREPRNVTTGQDRQGMRNVRHIGIW